MSESGFCPGLGIQSNFFCCKMARVVLCRSRLRVFHSYILYCKNGMSVRPQRYAIVFRELRCCKDKVSKIKAVDHIFVRSMVSSLPGAVQTIVQNLIGNPKHLRRFRHPTIWALGGSVSHKSRSWVWERSLSLLFGCWIIFPLQQCQDFNHVF